MHSVHVCKYFFLSLLNTLVLLKYNWSRKLFLSKYKRIKSGFVGKFCIVPSEL